MVHGALSFTLKGSFSVFSLIFTEIDCHTPDLSYADALATSEFNIIPLNTRYMDAINISCNLGYEFVNYETNLSLTITCLWNESWSKVNSWCRRMSHFFPPSSSPLCLSNVLLLGNRKRFRKLLFLSYIAINCSNPDLTYANAILEISPPQNMSYGSIQKVICPVGRKFSPQSVSEQVICQANRTWTTISKNCACMWSIADKKGFVERGRFFVILQFR